MARWLEIAAHYGCNNQCLGCFSVNNDGPSMTSTEIVDTLRYGRAQGAKWLWVGGGEPTLRRDLFATVAAARKLGYERVKLQTNGMMLAYPEFTRRCVDAGVTEINFSIKGATAAEHDGLARTAGCFDLMMKAIALWKETGLASEGDILVYRSNVRSIPAMVRHYHAAGIERFNLWMLSPAAQSSENLVEQMPTVTDVVAATNEALALGLSERPDFITSLHTPLCTLTGQAAGCVFSATELDLIVANPGGHRFKLEESPIEGGTYSERCQSCRVRSTCGGFPCRLRRPLLVTPSSSRSADQTIQPPPTTSSPS